MNKLVYLQQLQESIFSNEYCYDFHMHTSWTDGQHSIEEMYVSACEQALRAICFTEHARASSGDWYHSFSAEVRALPKKVCQAFVGVEVKVLDFEGSLDLSDKICNDTDFVMGSVHRFPNETDIKELNSESFKASKLYEDPINTEYQLSMAMLDNPKLDILGHPFGMSIRRFKLLPPRKLFIDLIQKAKQNNKAFEINAHYHKSCIDLLQMCKEIGCLVTLGSNAHSRDKVGYISQRLLGERHEEV